MKLVAGPGVETPAQARAERIDRGGPPATGAPTAAYESRPFLKVRRGYADVLTASRRKDIVHGLFEIDATLARSLLHDLRSSGVDVSFTAFLVHALAQAVDEDRSVQAYRRHHRLIIFDDVDVNTQIETTIDGQRLAQTLMIRAANRKTVNELTSEIRRAQHRDPTAQRRYRRTLLFLTLPRLLRTLAWRVVLAEPTLFKQLDGTVALSAIGMFGPAGGWGIPVAPSTLMITVGGIAGKPPVRRRRPRRARAARRDTVARPRDRRRCRRGPIRPTLHRARRDGQRLERRLRRRDRRGPSSHSSLRITKLGPHLPVGRTAP